MVKEYKRGNCEIEKPKQNNAPTIPADPFANQTRP